MATRSPLPPRATHPDWAGVCVLGRGYQRAHLGDNVKPHSAIHVSLVITWIPDIHPPNFWVCLPAGCETGEAEGIGAVCPKAPMGKEWSERERKETDKVTYDHRKEINMQRQILGHTGRERKGDRATTTLEPYASMSPPV